MVTTTRSTLFLLVALLSVLSAASASAANPTASSVHSLDGDGWRIAVDPKNEGREAKWYATMRPEAKPTRVPWIIQDPFPAYHGVAWYWREFDAPPNPHTQGRTLLRFWAVDYAAQVWLNGQCVGEHEGGETPFVLDVTDAIRAGARNLLAVRVLNPTHERIDGIALNETPKQARVIPYMAGWAYNHGGVTGSVELLAVPLMRIEDLFARADAKTGVVTIDANVRNAGKLPLRGRLQLSIAPAAAGETLTTDAVDREFPPGDTTVAMKVKIEQPRLWNLNDPFLYRVTARLATAKSEMPDERSVRCGFRDFRFENGYFRLNGRRLFIRSTHTCNHFPVGLKLPPDPDMARRDLLDVKAMGFNMIRFIWGGAEQFQLDLCDEIGLMVYDESFAAYPIQDSPQLAARWKRSVAELIRRDRNHPSIVVWGLLNEIADNAQLRLAVASLPMVRQLDDSRMVMLNSGRFDLGGGQSPVGMKQRPAIGTVSNPGSTKWENEVVDYHFYPRVPHTADIIRSLRTMAGPGIPLFLSEYGIGSAVDLWRTTRHFERLGKTDVEDARFYRHKLDRFLADWERWKLDELYPRPEDFFTASQRKMAGQRTLGLNAIRSNPSLVGYSLTGMNDHVSCGEGLTTTFRELKPGAVDAMFEGFAPLRLCLFVEPVNVYRGARVRLEAVLANEDALAPGDYPVRLLVVGPKNRRVFEKTVNVTIGKQSPFTLPVFSQDSVVDGPSGRYRFLASLERGGAATGGEAEFHVADPAELPTVTSKVVLASDDAELAKWLAGRGVQVAKLDEGPAMPHEAILVSKTPPDFEKLWARVRRGATVVFLSPEVLKKDNQPLGWLPLANKGSLFPIQGWLYLKDEWAKTHPIFDGLPSGGLMDYTFYREVIPDLVFAGQEPPAEAVAGAIKASQDYASGLMLAVYKLDAGRIVVNTLLIRENLGSHPAADRLLLNLLRYASRHD
jgi:hypothetical protein